jgi:translation initiation factor 2 subunit 3
MQASQVKAQIPKQPECNIGTAGHVDHGKCLTIDEYTIFNGRLLTGREILNLVRSEGRLIALADGGELYSLGQSRVFTVDESLRPVESEALVFVERYAGPIYVVRTRSGRRVSVTPEHPLLVNRGGRIIWVRARELEPGDHLSLVSYLPIQAPLGLPDPMDRLRERYQVITSHDYHALRAATGGFTCFTGLRGPDLDKVRVLAGIPKRRLARLAHVAPGPLNAFLRGEGTLTARQLRRVYEVLSRAGIKPPRPDEYVLSPRGRGCWRPRRVRDTQLDEEVVGWLACVWARGRLSEGRLRVRLPRRELMGFLRVSRERFGLHFRPGGRGSYLLSSKPLVEYLQARFLLNPGGRGACSLPPWVISLPPHLKRVLLRRYITLRGRLDGETGRIEVAPACERDMVTLGYLLLSFGLLPRFSEVRRPTGRGFRCYYRLTISGRQNLRVFYEEIGFQDKLRSKALKRRLTGKVGSRDYPFRIPVDVEVLRQLLQAVGRGTPGAMDAGLRAAWRYAARTGRISRCSLLKLLEWVNQRLTDAEGSRCEDGMLQRARALAGQLGMLARSALEFDPIKSVERVDYRGYIFDLSVPGYRNFVAGRGALVCHNTTLVQGLTGKWTSAHSEELRRGITIRVGYADAAFYRCEDCPPPLCYSSQPRCPACGREARFLRAVSFVDCPGHESLMANMLSGAALMDGAILVIAANERVPQPQTREHLQALQMLGTRRIVVAQNKVDLVSDEEALKNYEGIREFLRGTVAEDSPIIPISAQHSVNLDALIEAIEERIPTPRRDPELPPLLPILRSFDVNRPGTPIGDLKGGVVGGTLIQGTLQVGDEVEIRPGIYDEARGRFTPIQTRVVSLGTGAGFRDRVHPGGLVAVGTQLDPYYTKADALIGQLLGRPGCLPPVLDTLSMETQLFEVAVGDPELRRVEPLRPGEVLRLNIATAVTLGTITSIRDGLVEVKLRRPVCVPEGARAAISRRIADRWRLIGSGALV